MVSRKRLVLSFVILACLILILWLTSAIWLRAIGAALVADSAPRRADAALVLAGDHRGNRILKACELLRGGHIRKVLVSGPMNWYGINEADLAIRFAASTGCPAESFQPVYIKALSTTEEAQKFRPELERQGVRSLLLVTSNFHTARALRTFRREMPANIELVPIAAADPYYTPETWWHTREGQKTAFFELSKTAADWIGL